MSLELSLYTIEDDLLSLYQMREEAATDCDTAIVFTGRDSAQSAELMDQLRVIDEQIAEYVKAEIRKADGIGHHWRHFKLMGDAARAEAKRLSALADSWDARLDRLKAMCLHVMETFEWRAGKPRVIEGKTTRLYLKGNGGKQAVDITDESMVPDEFCMVTITMRADWFAKIDNFLAERGMNAGDRTPVTIKRTPSLSLIGAALDRNCEPCGGLGIVWRESVVDHPVFGPEVSRVEDICGACGGSGKCGVPGARLLERGQHVECK